MALDPLKTWALGASTAAALQVSSGIELLVTAAANNQLQVLKHAIELQGIPVDVLLQWGPSGGYPAQQRTLCQIAACSGCFDAVHYLLSKGADPNGKSPDDGYTALHCAAASGHPRTAEIIAVLLHFGGSRDVLDAAGRKPVDLLAELIDAQHGVLLPGQAEVGADVPGLSTGPSELDSDEFKTDDFRMFGFKVAKCSKCRAHDWTECAFAHPGEKARRRDPTKFAYSGSACPDFRKGTCKRGDSCQFAHGVFECWLHPARYRTQLCKDAPMCTRRVCFFAHSLPELRQPTDLPTPALSIDGASSPQTPEASDMPATSSPGGRQQQQLRPFSPSLLANALQHMSSMSLDSSSGSSASMLGRYSSNEMYTEGSSQLSSDCEAVLANCGDASALLTHLQSLTAGAAGSQADPRGFGGFRASSYEALDQWISALTNEGENEAAAADWAARDDEQQHQQQQYTRVAA